MIDIKFEMDESRKLVSLHVKGHAGQNTLGSDIVCASASILTYTIAQNVMYAEAKGILKYKPTIRLKEGDAIVTCRAKDDEGYAELLHTYLVIQAGYQVLAYNYPDYVFLTMFGATPFRSLNITKK